MFRYEQRPGGDGHGLDAGTLAPDRSTGVLSTTCLEPGQRHIGGSPLRERTAFSCGGVIRCNPAAPAASPKKRCSANWEYCSFVELSWSNVRESAVKPDAGNPHVRFDERGWKRGGAQASVLALILDSTN
jgi:hypothetical protein